MHWYYWLLIAAYLYVGSVASRSAGADIRKSPEGATGKDEFFMVTIMLFWPLAFVYAILVVLASGKSNHGKKNKHAGQGPPSSAD